MSQRSKGLRYRLTTRIPQNLADQVIEEATRRGMTVNDWLLWSIRRTLEPSRAQPATGAYRDRTVA